MPCIYKHCCKKVGRRAASTEAQRTASCRRRPRSPPPPPVQLFSRNPTSFTCSTPMLFLLEPDGASRCLKEHDNYIVELLPDTSAGVQVVSAELNYVASIEHLGGQGKFSRALCSPPPPPPPPPPSPAAAYAASAASNHWVQTSTSRYCKRMMARTACLRSCGKGRWAPMPAELPLASAPPCNRCPGTLDPLSHPPPPPLNAVQHHRRRDPLLCALRPAGGALLLPHHWQRQHGQRQACPLPISRCQPRGRQQPAAAG